MKKKEDFEETLRADQKREKTILWGELTVLLLIALLLTWCFQTILN